ncbi:flagellar motor switch protein FliM [Atrimonas thermophila]|uniref:flagellar motor switch protein FliM n=1 Tax=Atrimonas thermophila TaxID=3064161 RepID=UPI00399CF3D6
MSKEILSQEEIDALLKALTEGEETAEAVKQEIEKEKVSERRVKVYDFRRPERFSKDQIRTFHMIFSAFSRLASTNLAAFLRSRVQINLLSVDQLTYDEFVRSVPSPTYLCIFSMLPLEGRCLLQISLDIVFLMLDRLLGGPGGVPAHIRALTEIENRIMGGIMERVMMAMTEAWSSIYSIEPRIEAMESNLEFVQIVSGNDMVILFSFEIEIGDRQGMLTVCIPYIVVEPITRSLSASLWFASRKSSDPETQKNVERLMGKVKLPISVELGRTNISLGDFLELEVGDVVVLNQRLNKPLNIRVGKKVKMVGVPGRVGNRIAVRVDRLKEETNHE